MRLEKREERRIQMRFQKKLGLSALILGVACVCIGFAVPEMFMATPWCGFMGVVGLFAKKPVV